MKKILTKVGILTAIFILAVLIISTLMGKETTDSKVDMAKASLPVLSMQIGESQVNRLFGYKKEMQVDFMRDSLTPLDTDKKLTLLIQPNGHKIKSVTYEVRTSDGSKVVENAKIKSFQEVEGQQKASFTIDTPIRMNQEYSLCYAVETDQEKIYYYTRLIQRAGLSTTKYIEFAENFYQNCLNTENSSSVASSLETDATVSNSSFTHVNIHSTLEQVKWGKLEPKIYRKPIPTIKDINETTGSVTLDYMITAKNPEGKEELYQVSDFYRMRYTQSRIMLLDFERTANQIFDGTAAVFTKEGVNLGVASKDVQYVTNKNADILTFVQEGDLWSYNRTASKLTKIFSYRQGEEGDERDAYYAHDIKVVRVGETGDIDFVLYGYANRGEHEGIVGTAVYHYSSDQNVLEEKFFLPSTKSYEFLKEDLGVLSYASTKGDLYLMLEGNLYCMSIEERTYEVLKENISKDCFVVSSTHAHAAWMEEMQENQSSTITEIDFETGNTRTIHAAPGTKIKAFGFINEDLVYGNAKDDCILTDIAGVVQFGMNEVRIEDFGGTLVKNYDANGNYVMDVNIERGLIELVRAKWEDGAYVLMASDHIMNNIQPEDKTVTISTKISERQGTQIRLNFNQLIKDKNPLLLEAKLTKDGENHTLNMEPKSEETQEFYVYAKGKLDGIYTKVNQAVLHADLQTGVVLNRAQQYVWERGNLKLKVTLDLADIPEEIKKGVTDEKTLQEAVGDEKTILNLTGCSLDSILYEVSASRPVVAKISDTESVVIVGYDAYNTILYNPTTAETYFYGMNDSRALFAAAGNVFMSYTENRKE